MNVGTLIAQLLDLPRNTPVVVDGYIELRDVIQYDKDNGKAILVAKTKETRSYRGA